MEMSKSSSLVLERVEWMSLSTHSLNSVNSVMVETLKMCDVSETNYRGENGLELAMWCET